MAQYNHKYTKIQKITEKAKNIFKPLPQVIPTSKWDQMALELSQHKKKSRKLIIGLAVSILLNLIAVYLIHNLL